MTKEMYKAQYRKEIYERTAKFMREFSHTPIIEVRQQESTACMIHHGYLFGGDLSDEQIAAFDEIRAEFDKEWNAYRAHQIDHLRRFGLLRY